MLHLLGILFPICFVVLLGVAAGFTRLLDQKASEILSTLALRFCLPALMFVATATMPLTEMANWRLLTGVSLGIALTFVLVFTAVRFVFHSATPVAAMQAINGGGPDMAAIGVPLLSAVIGKGSLLALVVGNVFASLVMIPIALALLGRGSDAPSRQGSPLSAALATLRNPLVWAPLAGVVVALAHVSLPGPAKQACVMIGDALPGVSLFALGLFLTSQRMHFGPQVLLNVVTKLLGQPLIMWGLALLLGVTGAGLREMVLLGALPTGTISAMFSIQYKVASEDTEASILLSVIGSIATLSIIIGLTS